MSITRKNYTLSSDEFISIKSLTESFVHDYMSHYDPSHDYNHINRVSALAKHLATTSTIPNLDHQLITLAALLHDVGDKKYLATDATPDPTPIQTFLASLGAPHALADSVQTVSSNVSFSNESKNPEAVAKVLEVYPELAIVQDADRLDALGAVGIARAFVFGGCKRPQDGMEGAVKHFGEKLLKLGSMMKTEEGKRMANERTERIRTFERWWNEEVGLEKAPGEKWKVEDSYNVGQDDF